LAANAGKLEGGLEGQFPKQGDLFVRGDLGVIRTQQKDHFYSGPWISTVGLGGNNTARGGIHPTRFWANGGLGSESFREIHSEA